MSTPARSGVFQTAPDRRVEAFGESISFDYRLYQQDVAGSIAHAEMLGSVGLLTPDECSQIVTALREIAESITAKIAGEESAFEWRFELEDIHMHIEHELIERLGDVGRKLHTGRSRNDQVSTAFRLWIRDALDRVDGLLRDLQAAFIGRCDSEMDIILPGYTHLQRAQPVIAPHYWLAFVEKFQRDRDRLADCRKRVNICSLGAAAMAGTTIAIDRHDAARRLGFDAVAHNSLDVSSDRDFAAESAFVLAMIATHLSGWAEEWILWSTTEFGFLDLPQEFCTGSSIMPQKINPDVLELTRGKTGRVVGNLQTLFVLLKGLPMAYNRDLQEDKPAVFDSFDTVEACLQLAAPLVREAKIRREVVADRIESGFLDATTLMEYFIRLGVPMRTAHHLVGSLVAAAKSRDVPLAGLPLDVFQEQLPELTGGVYEVLGVENAVRAFVSYGSTAPDQVRQQLDQWKKRLASG